MGLQNIRTEGGNAQLWLAYQPSLLHVDPKTGALAAQFDLRMRLRGPRGRILTETAWADSVTETSLLQPDAYLRRIPFRAPVGDWRIELELFDRITGRRWLHAQAFRVRDLRGPALSDIELRPELGGFSLPPLLVDVLTRLPEQIRFAAQVYPPEGRGQLTARAVLYRRQTGASDAERFRSVAQLARVLPRGGEAQAFEGRFQLGDLDDGDYLIELFLYEGDSLIAETGRAFSVEWGYLRDIFADLDKAADMMGYVALPTQVAAIKSAPSAEEKERRFLAFWEGRKAWGEGNAMQAMKIYFGRVFAANEQFAGARPGYATDRGRIWVLYGQPSQVHRAEWRNLPLEVWYYKDWDLHFAFVKDGEEFSRLRTN